MRNLPVRAESDPDALWAIEWRVTGRCDETCVYCYGPDKKAHPSDNELDRILSVITASSVPVVRLSGGEPLLVDRIDEVLSKLKAAGKIVVLSTNARRFLEIRDRLGASLDKLNVSIDGYDAATHAINGRRGFDAVATILQGFRASPPAYVVKVGTVLTARNIAVPDLLPRMHSLLTQYPISRWKICQYIPEGPLADKALRVDDEMFRFIADQFLEGLKEAPGRLEVDFASASDRDRAYFIVQPHGDVVVPVGDSRQVTEDRLGNVLVDDIADLIERWGSIASGENHRRNVSICRKGPALDRADRRILLELDRDPLLSYEEMAQLVGEAPRAAERKFARLVRTGVIRYFVPVVNLPSLGLSVYLAEIRVAGIPTKTMMERFGNHPRVGWLVDTMEQGIVLAAIFADSSAECSKVLDELAEVSGQTLMSVTTSEVYDKYVLGQRYLASQERASDLTPADSRIAFASGEAHGLADKERLIPASIRELRSPGLQLAAQQAGMEPAELQALFADLRRRGVIVKFQPVYDVRKLGYRWFLVALRTRWLDSSQRQAMLDHIRALKSVVHINCVRGTWDLNFEVHADGEQGVTRILDGLEREFPNTVVEHVVREINQEYKYSYLTDCVLRKG